MKCGGKWKNLKGKDFDVEVVHEDKDLIKVCTKGLMTLITSC